MYGVNVEQVEKRWLIHTSSGHVEYVRAYSLNITDGSLVFWDNDMNMVIVYGPGWWRTVEFDSEDDK